MGEQGERQEERKILHRQLLPSSVLTGLENFHNLLLLGLPQSHPQYGIVQQFGSRTTASLLSACLLGMLS